MKNYFFKIFFLLCMVMNLHAQQKQSGLYVGNEFQGEMDFYESLDWIALNAQDGGEYSIVLKENLAVSSNVLDYEGKSVIITLKSAVADTNIQLSYATRSPSSSLFTIKKGVTFVLENGIELIGRSSASRPPVTVDGGNFIMNGGTIKDSVVDHSSSWFGGGVDILRGSSFVMNDGIISGNSCSGGGAGINVGENSTFIMNGGYISNNSIRDKGMGTGFGGGVFVGKNATFTMNNGTIMNNMASYGNGYGGGGGVYVNGTFTMVDGSIKNNICEKDRSVRGDGGGVYVSGIGEFVMHGGTISENEGGVYIRSYILSQFIRPGNGKGKFTMNGGKISNNINKYYNSGVHVDGMFIMNNGVIEKNGCRKGGGVYVEEGSFIMNDGTIKENFAYGSSGYSYGGGGIYI